MFVIGCRISFQVAVNYKYQGFPAWKIQLLVAKYSYTFIVRIFDRRYKMQGYSSMSAQQKTHSAALRFAMLAVAALGLAACTSASSVGVLQEGALRTDTYPSFGKVPQGETKQLTFEEKDQIAAKLASAKTNQGRADASGSSRAEIEARKRQLQAETAATLNAIETGQ